MGAAGPVRRTCYSVHRGIRRRSVRTGSGRGLSPRRQGDTRPRGVLACIDRTSGGRRGVRAQIPGGRQAKDYRRRKRRLTELGEVEQRVLADGEEVGPWAEMFLALERKGWKGRLGTAMDCAPPDAAFFREMCQGAHAAGRLMMLAIFLDGQPLAMQCNLRSGNGSFAFKVAYDEDYASHSPGWLLELYNIELLHGDRGIEWMDSCASHDNPINRVWKERRFITNRWISTGRAPGDLLVALMPLVSWLRRKTRRRATSGGCR
ncbi:GNAT family N-acetyltransferase [Mycobacterium sp. ITM-2016-00317]|uniref:GNAT family N-acetyltransferase n=1 Tax=Mycobacterium sp. ITM-2016-00317 TaxID=2099694 RepID=UPI00287F648D|nr:GNAT family N-acetyltransferase [Mycobacterium sp. ITM-2016-00317]WNG90460.1 GNAT family N-acetyltransferase [Mycobacterium sp. ITM-2016-00317]